MWTLPEALAKVEAVSNSVLAQISGNVAKRRISTLREVLVQMQRGSEHVAQELKGSDFLTKA